MVARIMPPGRVSFMLARPHLPPQLGLLPDLSEGKEREAVMGGDVLDDWTARFVVQAAVPGAQRLAVEMDGRQQQVLVDVESEAWAALRQEDGQWFVRQGGDVALWDAAEEQLARWAAAGRPRLEEVAVTVTSGGLSYDW
jgi:hypothetical protein